MAGLVAGQVKLPPPQVVVYCAPTSSSQIGRWRIAYSTGDKIQENLEGQRQRMRIGRYNLASGGRIEGFLHSGGLCSTVSRWWRSSRRPYKLSGLRRSRKEPTFSGIPSTGMRNIKPIRSLTHSFSSLWIGNSCGTKKVCKLFIDREIGKLIFTIWPQARIVKCHVQFGNPFLRRASWGWAAL